MNAARRTAAALGVLAAAFLFLGAGAGIEAPTAAGGRMELLSDSARPGEPVTVAAVFRGRGAEGARSAGTPASRVRAILVAPDGRRLAAAPVFRLAADDAGDEVYCAILAVPSTAPSGRAKVILEDSGGAVMERPLELRGREFAREDVALNRSNTELRTAESLQKQAESTALWGLLVAFDPDAAFAAGPFQPPVDSTRRTSLFGDRRRYRYADGSSETSIHAGIDYGVPRGTPVRAAAAGRVVLARPRIVTGNSVVIEHLPGVFTLYYHLDRLDVAEGDAVEAGRLIGASGSTGLSTGPHLHWEVRVSGEATDPDAFLERAVLDKGSVLSKIGGNHDR